jgi:hypothetical protein
MAHGRLPQRNDPESTLNSVAAIAKINDESGDCGGNGAYCERPN